MVAANILVVDDEPLVARSCRRILGDKGYHVETALSGHKGLELALGSGFDLVLTDLRMPDLDGMELVRALANKRPATAVVIITGYGTVASAVEATKLGVKDYIEKPFTPDQISEAVGKALPGKALRHAPGIQAEQVKKVLRMASSDEGFGRRLLFEGSRVLSGFPLSDPAKAAIVSGDVAWIEKRCGELSPEESRWLARRLEAEIW